MAVETILFKLEGVQQATEVSSLIGKTYTVGKVTSINNGLGTGLMKWLFLVPAGETAGGTVALKIEGGRQVAQMAGLVGKSVTVGQAPTVVGGVGNWLVLNSGSGAAAAGAAGVAGAKGGAAGSKLLLMQLEGAQQAAQVKAIAGKTFTVIPSPVVGGTAKGWLFMKPLAGGAGVAGKDLVALQVQGGTQANLSGLVGKSFTLSKAPLATGNLTGSWVLLQPASGAAAKGAAAAAGGTAVAAKGATGAAAGLPPVDGWQEFAANATGTAKAAALPGGGIGGTAAPMASKALVGAGGGKVVAGAAKSGTIWNGSGLSLGLGMGLGVWGPVILTSFLAAAGYGAYRYYQSRRALEAEGEMVEAG
ncbi:MAG: hypothetical protein HQL90_15910 [Magnetococcales bacterium]|nr:hypothetical protein [Magnetococcales bacterium]